MDTKLKLKWIRALRSGQYQRGKEALADCDGNKFCCLGVLADIQGCTWKEDRYGLGLVPITQSGRAIVSTTNKMLPPKHAGGLGTDFQKKLAEMNDEGKSFRWIADYIEKNL